MIFSGGGDDSTDIDDDLLEKGEDDVDEGWAKELTIDDLIEMDELLESDEENVHVNLKLKKNKNTHFNFVFQY